MRRRAGFISGDRMGTDGGGHFPSSLSNWFAKETSSTPGTESSTARASHNGDADFQAKLSNIVSSISTQQTTYRYVALSACPVTSQHTYVVQVLDDITRQPFLHLDHNFDHFVENVCRQIKYFYHPGKRPATTININTKQRLLRSNYGNDSTLTVESCKRKQLSQDNTRTATCENHLVAKFPKKRYLSQTLQSSS